MVRDVLGRARKRAREAIEALYEGTCTIVVYGKTKNQVTKITSVGEIIAIEGQPCRLSFSSQSAAQETDTVTNVDQSIKLFIAPEVAIVPGSKIIVTQCGRTTVYESSGMPAVYETHQEINLKIHKERA